MNILRIDKDLTGINLRPEQTECIDAIFDHMKTNDSKFYLLDLPTGVGKSILALSFMVEYLRRVNPNANFDLITESKLLQKQYADEFKSVSSLSGKNNYVCKTYKDSSCAEGVEFSKILSTKCEGCPYTAAKVKYMGNNIGLTNFHMYITLLMAGMARDANVLIVDESHELETVFSDFITITISKFVLSSFMMESSQIDAILDKLLHISNIDEYIDFHKKVLTPVLVTHNDSLNKRLINNKDAHDYDAQLHEAFDFGTDNKADKEQLRVIRSLNNIEQFIKRFDKLIDEYNKNNNNFVLEKEVERVEGEVKKKVKLTIQPVWVHDYFNKTIWDKYDKVILMSGTILNKSIFCYTNGIDPKDTFYYRIKSPFEIKNRPIYYIPCGKFTYKEKEESFKNALPKLKKVLAKYKAHKGIIHTVTFEMQDWLLKSVPSDRYLSHTSDIDSKKLALYRHYNENNPSILVSPSMGTGIDLKNERARFQVLLKIPYPSLASLKNKKRLETNREWYAWITVAKIVQYYGRAVRSNDDFAHFFIFDSSLSELLRYSSEIFPEWVLDAIKFIGNEE